MTDISPPMKNIWTTTKNEKTYFMEVKIQEKQIVSYEKTGHYKSKTGGNLIFDELLICKWDDWFTTTFVDNPLIETNNTVRDLCTTMWRKKKCKALSKLLL